MLLVKLWVKLYLRVLEDSVPSRIYAVLGAGVILTMSGDIFVQTGGGVGFVCVTVSWWIATRGPARHPPMQRMTFPQARRLDAKCK